MSVSDSLLTLGCFGQVFHHNLVPEATTPRGVTLIHNHEEKLTQDISSY